MCKCIRCGSFAINHACHGRDGSDGDLCDVCYWRKRTENYAVLLVHAAKETRDIVKLLDEI